MHIKLSTSRKLSMALLPLLAAARQTLQLYVDPRFTSVRYIHAQKLGQKMDRYGFRSGFYLNPGGLCLPSLLVIQSIRRVSRPGRLGKLEKTRLRVNSGPKKKLQSRLSAYPDTQPPTLPLPNEATTSDSAKVNTRYMLTHMTKTHIYCQLSPTSRFWSWYLLRKVSRQFWMLVSMFSAGARLDPCLGRGPAEGNLIWLPGEQHLKMRKMAKTKWKRLWIKI